MEKEWSLGIELGSTRIKAALIDEKHCVLASGSSRWENRFEEGNWTYSLQDIHEKLRQCVACLQSDVQEKFGKPLTQVGAIGISAMMHGYLAFDEEWNLLVPFRTWRNTSTAQAADELTALFGQNIPQRWSISHLYQAMLRKEVHLEKLRRITTLAGYIHYLLTGRFVLGVGDASGMFPVDTQGGYDLQMKAEFEKLAAEKGYTLSLSVLLPQILFAGEAAGTLTEEGARFLDPTGNLLPGAVLCPPEGDAGTGMVATNAVQERTGNLSAGTSAFAMIVLERPLKKLHREIDLVTTPHGKPVAMVHCNNCTGDLNGWAELLYAFAQSTGANISRDELFSFMFQKAMEGETDCGGLLSYNYLSGEHVVGLTKGRPMFLRTESSQFTLPNFLRCLLYSALGALKKGVDILQTEEEVELQRLLGHGGFFKTPEAGQKVAAAVFRTPVSVMETADQGGAWGIAILARYAALADKPELPCYLNEQVFAKKKTVTVYPEQADIEGFSRYYEAYCKALPVQQAAGEHL